jgi:hypothetical protein
MSRVRIAALVAAVWTTVSGLADPAMGQLAADRFAGLPAQPALGLGAVRLSGMGGFLAAVPDENQEISLFDFSSNPAGFGDDRDSWTIDIRYSHAKYVEGTGSLAGNDVSVNDGTFALAYHQPRRFGVGGAIDYSEANARDVAETQESYKIAGFRLIGSKYLFSKFIAGLNLGYSGEDQSVSSSEVYIIEHKATVPHVGLGVAYLPVTGVTLGFRGDAFPTTIDGTSASSTHEDSFNWERPATAWSAHAFLDRGRLEGGVDYTRRKVEGKESVRLSWSERFVWNPTPRNLTLETDTFSEDRTAEALRIRARLDVVPKRLSVSGGFASSNEDFTVLSNPNALGSLTRAKAEGSSTLWLAGAAYTMMRDRLLLAAEIEQSSLEFDRVSAVDDYRRNRDNLSLRVGGEYLVGEKVAVRAGLIRGNSDLETLVANDPEMTYLKSEAKSGSFGSWRLATGLGFVPQGGIWQLDFAYDITLDSAQNDAPAGAPKAEDLSQFAAYVRYLF